MAYNKETATDRLTPRQEKFIDAILAGKTQRQAYYEAYPKSKTWKENTVDSRASVLMSNKKVSKRLTELGYRTHDKVIWTRQKALDTINYVMDMNRQDMERIAEACQTEIDLWEARLNSKGQEMASAIGNPSRQLQIAKEMQDITETIQKLKKQRRTNTTNIKGIFEGAKILNRMFGYDITKVEVTNKDEDKEELNKLNADELKAVLANINKGE